LSGRGLCVELITRPEESYRLCCVVVFDLETSRKKNPWPTGGCRAKNKQKNCPPFPHQVTPMRIIIVGSIGLCIWGHYVASKRRDSITHRRAVISCKNRIPRYTTAKIS